MTMYYLPAEGRVKTGIVGFNRLFQYGEAIWPIMGGKDENDG